MVQTKLIDELSCNLSENGKTVLRVAMQFPPLSRAAAHWDAQSSNRQDDIGFAIGLSAPFPAADKGRSLGLTETEWSDYDQTTSIVDQLVVIQ